MTWSGIAAPVFSVVVLLSRWEGSRLATPARLTGRPASSDTLVGDGLCFRLRWRPRASACRRNDCSIRETIPDASLPGGSAGADELVADDIAIDTGHCAAKLRCPTWKVQHLARAVVPRVLREKARDLRADDQHRHFRPHLRNLRQQRQFYQAIVINADHYQVKAESIEHL